jgi:neopullulanase
MSIEIPSWVKDAIFYQIFPDRFARSERVRHARGIQFKPWGTPPEEQGFQGGDLFGIVDKLDYLQELGVNALYLNPIFSSASNHRYHTFDYFTVDPLLGGNQAFRELLDAAHQRGMRVVLDGVFNHASRGFWAFHHVLETGGDSPYVDWFHIQDWPLQPYPPDSETPINYAAWWGIPALPKLNVSNPGVRDYLLEVASYWIEFGADGWRLDVPEEIDDPPFWREFRKVVRRANPDAYLVGEIWHDAQDWLRGDRFDAVMNYVFSRAALCFFGAKTLETSYRPGGFKLSPLTAQEFARSIQHMISLYSWEVIRAQLNLLDSHDTARALWILGGDISALRLCALFQMTMPGAPCIYYGDELGMTGATDPYCRAAFPWHDRSQWNEDLLDFYRRAGAMRRNYPALRRGGLATLYANQGIYACLRFSDEQDAIVIFNTNAEPVQMDIAGLERRFDGRRFIGVWNGSGDIAGRETIVGPERSPEYHREHYLEYPREYYEVREEKLERVRIPARDAVVLVSDNPENQAAG